MSKANIGDLVEVEWLDSTGRTGWEHFTFYEDWARKQQDRVHWTAGYLVAEDRKSVTVTLSWTDLDDDTHISDCMSIPKVAVKRVRVVERA